MTVTIDQYGEVSMKLTDWEDVGKWINEKPERLELSFNEAIKLYVEEKKSI